MTMGVRIDRRESGMAVAEVLVATLFFAVVGAGLAQGLRDAHYARRLSASFLSGVSLADETIEQVRSGSAPSGADSVNGMARRWHAAPILGNAGLLRLEVTVRWVNPQPGRFRLVTMLRAPREGR